MYVTLTSVSVFMCLIFHTTSFSVGERPFLTVGLKKTSHGVSPLSRLITKAAAIQKLATSSENITLTDVQDLYYYGPVEVGSPPVTISVVFDTGSADLWVASKYLCDHLPSYCRHHTVYNDSASSTYNSTKSLFTINYQKGQVSGIVAQDNVNIGGLPIDGQLFGEAVDMDTGTASEEFAGLFGMSYPSLAQIDVHTPLVNLYVQGLLDQPVFAFSLNKKREGVDGGELTLGGLDPSHYTGNIAYTPVIEQEYWKIRIGGILVGSNKVVPPSEAIADSGTSLILGPKDYIDRINNVIGGQDFGSGIFIVDCRRIWNMPVISIIVEEQNLILEPYDYILQVNDDAGDLVCISGFSGFNNMDFFVLGDVFMRKFYTVFDMANNRVGFALNREVDIPTTHSSIISGGYTSRTSLWCLVLAVTWSVMYNTQ